MLQRLFIALTATSLTLAIPAAAQVADQPNPAAPETGQTQKPGDSVVSGVTVTPKTGKVDPKLQCLDEACVKQVVAELKTRYPQVYRGLMQWCMLNDTGRMSYHTSDAKALLDQGNGDVNSTFDGVPSVQKVVCDDRFAKTEAKAK